MVHHGVKVWFQIQLLLALHLLAILSFKGFLKMLESLLFYVFNFKFFRTLKVLRKVNLDVINFSELFIILHFFLNEPINIVPNEYLCP